MRPMINSKIKRGNFITQQNLFDVKKELRKSEKRIAELDKLIESAFEEK